jgi:hypothetical protein
MAGPSRWRRRAALADGGEGCHPSRTPRPRGRRSARGGTTEAGRRPATARAVQCSFLALHHRRPGRPHKPASRAGSAENFGTRRCAPYFAPNFSPPPPSGLLLPARPVIAPLSGTIPKNER